jgi:hypothetical protein
MLPRDGKQLHKYMTISDEMRVKYRNLVQNPVVRPVNRRDGCSQIALRIRGRPRRDRQDGYRDSKNHPEDSALSTESLSKEKAP